MNALLRRLAAAASLTAALASPVSAQTAGAPEPGVPPQPGPPAPTPEATAPAAPPAPAPAPPAPPPAAGAETIDLAALGVRDESQAASATEPLQIYGFADFSYFVPLYSKDSFLAATLWPNQQFTMGRFNIYMAKEISSRLRALGEVRFAYMPNGSPDPNAPLGRVSTEAQDPTDAYRIQHWGSIIIERLQIDYDLFPGLTLRAGQFLTPYGIWNVDHGTPTLIGIRRPYIIGEGLFPERQVGLELIGRTFLSEFALEYHLTLSNGRGPIMETRELDSNKAVGGRVVLGWKRGFDLRLGVSYYRGRYTNRTQETLDLATTKTVSTIVERYEEQAVGADLAVDFKNFVFRGEFASADRRYDDNFRGLTSWTPDNRRWGVYGVAGYRLPFNLMPYAIFEYYAFPQTAPFIYVATVDVYRGGLNYQLHPSVIIKLEYTYGKIAPPSTSQLPNGASFDFVRNAPYESVETQVSWVF